MKSFKASSSTIDTVVHINNVLIVSFVSGAVYAYPKTSEALFDEFEKAPSKGQFLNQMLKNQFLNTAIRIG